MEELFAGDSVNFKCLRFRNLSFKTRGAIHLNCDNPGSKGWRVAQLVCLLLRCFNWLFNSHHLFAIVQQLLWDGHQRPCNLVRLPVETGAKAPQFPRVFLPPWVSAVRYAP